MNVVLISFDVNTWSLSGEGERDLRQQATATLYRVYFVKTALYLYDQYNGSC